MPICTTSQDDQNVLFVYIKDTEKYEGPGEAEKYRTLNLTMKDERGSSIPKQGELVSVKKGSTATVEWTIPAGYELVSVNGNRSYKKNYWTVDSLEDNQDVEVIVRLQDEESKSYLEPDNHASDG